MAKIDPALAQFCDERQPAHLDELKRWIAIPSISADPGRVGDVSNCCLLIVDRMREIGLDASVLETDGNPIAYGEWLGAPGKPTILIYGHYDVQPVDPIELWTSPPFEGTVRDGKIFGRGAVDDKGQVLMHLAAIDAHLRTRGRLPVNVKVVVEGEEEIGSPNFDTAVDRYKRQFSADAAVISDTSVFAEDVPSLTTSVRGLVHWEIEVRGPAEDVHSGYFGGVVHNPLEALAQIIAGLKDAQGRVTVEGFYDGVGDLDSALASELRALPYDESHEAAQLGVPSLAGEAGRMPLERMWYRPTLECNGMWGGYSGPGYKTIIPSWGKAKLSARLVGEQDPLRVRRAVSEHIAQHAPAGVRVNVSDGGEVRPVVISREHPVVAAAARAMEAGFGKIPVFIGTGGSIGPVATFDKILKLPQVLVGVGLPDDRIHAPNEKFNLTQFFGGIKTMAALYDEVAASGLGSGQGESKER
ncbi:MAG TPA: dipeptidase [Candidatus Baltobacteraceae bacterium]|jgi:acetylornithine deacetylase/succinyl-diaminopimelate desuccinylase-like protein|nr:dipeptidase [Candidatus Baltobacteraceae bacterium]